MSLTGHWGPWFWVPVCLTEVEMLVLAPRTVTWDNICPPHGSCSSCSNMDRNHAARRRAGGDLIPLHGVWDTRLGVSTYATEKAFGLKKNN